MNRNLVVLSTICVFIFVGASAPHAQSEPPLPPDCIDRSADGSCKHLVSIVRLIADPGTFDGKRVLLSGFLHLEFEGNAIYLHRDDWIHGITENALWVSFAPGGSTKSCQNKYVSIEGTFSAAERGHMGLFSGTLKDISRCLPTGTAR